jgi:hypothetical protein
LYLEQEKSFTEEYQKAMISFALAQELKNAGFNPNKNANAVYFINDHLKIRREDALRMWYGDKARVGMDLDLSKEVVTGQVRLHFFPQTTVQNFLDSGI